MKISKFVHIWGKSANNSDCKKVPALDTLIMVEIVNNIVKVKLNPNDRNLSLFCAQNVTKVPVFLLSTNHFQGCQPVRFYRIEYYKTSEI